MRAHLCTLRLDLLESKENPSVSPHKESTQNIERQGVLKILARPRSQGAQINGGQYDKIAADMRSTKYNIQGSIQNGAPAKNEKAETPALCDAPDGFVREEHSPIPFFTHVS